MPFPLSTRVVFERNPLANVLCQLRFHPILQITATAPADFQNEVRQTYPGFRVEGPAITFPINVAQAQPVSPMLNFPIQQTFVFEEDGGRRSVSLGQETLGLADTDYRRWEDFAGELNVIRGHFERIYQPPFYTRVGLRYQDIIKREELDLADAPWSTLLNPAFAGLLAASDDITADLDQLTTIAQFQVPDIDGATVRLQHGFVEVESPEAHPGQYAIDADFFVARRVEIGEVADILDTFHSHAGNLFRWAISERLYDALHPRALDAPAAGSASA